MQDGCVQEVRKTPFPVSGGIALRYAVINLGISSPLHGLIIWAGWQPEDYDSHLNPVALFVAGILLAPVLETFLNFWIPIWIVDKLFGGKAFAHGLAWIACVAPFVWVHYGGDYFHRSFLTALCTGVVCGTCFYLCYRRAEASEGVSAFWTTALCHSLFNGLVALVVGLLVVLTRAFPALSF
ncbi:hypothetical protein BAR24_02730 [Gluconobacter oxydans]|uniref:hypothetical protein n=1 Tax=Gluconobacter thailandicus TaxID=257438 RepID=UPI00029988FF|nr:hypothetical protein [Gluconobacter thailandicus]AFW00857.1 hypothetical protein B932_1273 [Gluconobacter oxydans H24]ANQ40477.1 hypothetical protein BAR24_02730 [Gluconobacter oxydans]